MLRLKILLPLLVALALANVAWLTYSRWGLITIHADNQPLSEVVRSIEKQSGIILKTNADAGTKVKMHVTRVPLTDALETLATVTETRWRLTYVFAPSKGEISNALANLSSGQPAEGWKTEFMPMGQMAFADVTEAPSDPRRDTWKVQVPEQKTLQAYLGDASRNVSAAFVFPESWNPAVSKTFKSDEIADLAPKLAKAVGGKVEEVFFLQSGGRRMEMSGEDGPPAGARPEGGRMGAFNREGMEQRMQAEIEKLPPDKRAAAQKEMEEMRGMFEGMRDLPPEQRMAKMEDMMSRPEIQERMEERESARDARRTPEQRVQRYKKYVERKAAAKSGQQPQGGGR